MQRISTLLRSKFHMGGRVRIRLLPAWGLAASLFAITAVTAVQARSRSAAAAPAGGALALLTPEALPSRAVLLTDVGACSRLRIDAIDRWQGNKPGDRQIEVSRVIFYKGVELEETITHNGKPLGRWQRSREHSEVRRAEKLVDQRWRGPQDNGRLVNIADEVWAVPDLLRNFQFQIEGSELFHGHPATVFHYAAAAHVHPTTRVERALASMTGRAWVDPQTGQVLRVEFKNHGPLKVGWGLLANFSSIQGSFEMQPVGNMWVRGHTEVRLAGRQLWNTINGTLIKDYKIE